MPSVPSPNSKKTGAGAAAAAGRESQSIATEGAPEGAPSVVLGPAFVRPQTGHRLLRGVGRHILVAMAIVLWIGAVVYPDPRPFVSSVARLKSPPIDAAAAAGMAVTLPDDYKAIEDFTLGYVPFATAWDVYGLPWYFPTVTEVVRDKAGDCQARAILLGSILAAKGMPYTMHYSFDHVWIDYPGKQATALDDPSTSFISDAGQGWLGGLPDKIPLRSIVEQRVAYHWTPMPLDRKITLLLGVILIIVYTERRLLSRAGRALSARFSKASGAGTEPSEAG